MALTSCRTHKDVPLVNGACPKCGWRPLSGRGVPSPSKSFKRPPEAEEYRRIRRREIKAVYECARCNRQAPAFKIVLCAGEYFCTDHYRDRRLELAYPEDERAPFLDEWREQKLAESLARHPEWARREDESRSEYQSRMMAVAKKLARQAGITYANEPIE